MEQQEKFEAVLKKSVAMYSMLTGKPMSVREGRAFIEIFDMTDAYLANGTDTDTAASAFDILSQVELRGPTDAEQRQRIAELVNNPPQFVGREPELAFCGCPVGYCTCTNEKLAEAARKMTVEMAREHGIDPAILTNAEVYVDPASPADDTKQSEIDAAWQSRDRDQAQEAQQVEHDVRARAYSEKSNRTVATTDRNKHPVGYDWQVCALCREGSRDNSTVLCYKSEPTPEEFFELYRLYDAQTHWVFVNRWNAGAQRWDKYLDEYLRAHEREIRNLRGTLPSRIVKVSKDPAELRGRDVSASPVTAPWEQEDKPWRIRYYSDTAGAVIFHYVDKRPTSAEMAHFHHAKCMAVSQAKPKQAA